MKRSRKIVEVSFDMAATGTLKESCLGNNKITELLDDFTIGDISNINIELDINKDDYVRIYSSRSSIHDYLNFLYLCYYLDNNNISVIFTDDFVKDAYNLCCITPDEIPELLKYEIKLTKDEIDRYKNEWLNLVKDNSDLRLFRDRKVISVNYSYLDKYIEKNYVKDDNNKTVAYMMINDRYNNFSAETCFKLLNNYLNK